MYQHEVTPAREPNPLAAFAPASVFNFRDVGGAPTVDGQTVHSGRLYRSDSLHRLTEKECAQLRTLGVRTVLDLRRPYEIERDGRIRDTSGVAYANIHPVHREWNPASYNASTGPARFLADRYLDMAEEGAEGFGEALRFLSDGGNAPVVMHCFAGKDRTGVLAALTLCLLGVPDPDIAMDYALSERARASVSAQILAESSTGMAPPPVGFLACPPEAIMLFLTELRVRHGSVVGFANDAGVTPEHIAALRDHMLS